MKRYLIMIDRTEDSWWWSGDDWKDEVCMDFDEHVVILGGRDYSDITEASWWNDATELIESLEYNDDEEDFLADHRYEYAEDKLKDVFEAYRTNPGYSDDTDFIAEVAMILDPSLKLESVTLRGYRESVDAVIEADIVDAEILEDWFFGDIYEVQLFELNTDDLAEVIEDSLENDDLAVRTDDNGFIDPWVSSDDLLEYYKDSEEGTYPLPESSYWKMTDKVKELAGYFGVPASETMIYEE